MDVVACGSLALKHRVGDVVPIVAEDESGDAAVLELKVVGRVAPPGFSVSLRISSNAFSADDLFSASDCFIAVPTRTNEESLSKYASVNGADRGMMIQYERDLDAVSLERARASLRSWGYLTTSEEMIANTERRMREDFNERFPIIMFFLIISSFSMIASVIVTQMKMYHNNAVYYLCGSTAPRCFLYSGIPAAFGRLFGSACKSGADRLLSYEYRLLVVVKAEDSERYNCCNCDRIFCRHHFGGHCGFLLCFPKKYADRKLSEEQIGWWIT